jgi:hypothetical protein
VGEDESSHEIGTATKKELKLFRGISIFVGEDESSHENGTATKKK